MPKSVKVIFKDESDGYFDYIISKTPTTVSLRSHIKLTHAIFKPDDYMMLRNFFDYIIKKHSEQFVFKKTTK